MVASSEIAPPWTERCDTVFPASATISWPLGESRVAPLPLTNCQAGSGGRHPLDSSVFNAEPGATQHAVARLKVLDLFSGITPIHRRSRDKQCVHREPIVARTLQVSGVARDALMPCIPT